MLARCQQFLRKPEKKKKRNLICCLPVYTAFVLHQKITSGNIYTQPAFPRRINVVKNDTKFDAGFSSLHNADTNVGVWRWNNVKTSSLNVIKAMLKPIGLVISMDL